MAAPLARPIAAVLIFPGIGDRIGYWSAAQEYLRQRGIASLIFHYSGYPPSTGSTTAGNLESDASAAYQHLRAEIPPATPVFLLGFSLGSGLATEVAQRLQPPPAGLILAQPYTSLRFAAGEIVRPLRGLRYLLPDIWRTWHTIANRNCPLLIVHSDADTLFPLSMAHSIHEAAIQNSLHSAHLAVPGGFRHNAIYLQVPPLYWQPILEFIVSNSHSPR